MSRWWSVVELERPLFSPVSRSGDEDLLLVLLASDSEESFSDVDFALSLSELDSFVGAGVGMVLAGMESCWDDSGFWFLSLSLEDEGTLTVRRPASFSKWATTVATKAPPLFNSLIMEFELTNKDTKTAIGQSGTGISVWLYVTSRFSRGVNKRRIYISEKKQIITTMFGVKQTSNIMINLEITIIWMCVYLYDIERWNTIYKYIRWKQFYISEKQ